MAVFVSSPKSSELGSAAEVLAQAFSQDPMVCSILRKLRPNRRLLKLRSMFEVSLQRRVPGRIELCLKDGGEVRSVALLYSPGKYPPPIFWELSLLLRCIFRAGFSGLPGWLTWSNSIRRRHPSEPHYYLEILGTHPAFQGNGFGSMLMEEICSLAGKAGKICYLETSNPRNLSFYKAFGFEPVASETILGVETWFLTRSVCQGR
jgi:ribosomal protein S18 acetylase RimI-like enzyme